MTDDAPPTEPPKVPPQPEEEPDNQVEESIPEEKELPDYDPELPDCAGKPNQESLEEYEDIDYQALDEEHRKEVEAEREADEIAFHEAEIEENSENYKWDINKEYEEHQKEFEEQRNEEIESLKMEKAFDAKVTRSLKEKESIAKSKPPLCRIPESVGGRAFTGRNNEYQDKIWEINSEGLASGDEKREVSETLIQAILKTETDGGIIVLSGSNYVLAEPNKKEKALMETWRKSKNEIAIDLDMDDIFLDQTPESTSKSKPKSPSRKKLSKVMRARVRSFLDDMIAFGLMRNQKGWTRYGAMTTAFPFIARLMDAKVIWKGGHDDNLLPQIYPFPVAYPATGKSLSYKLYMRALNRGNHYPDNKPLVYIGDQTREVIDQMMFDNENDAAIHIIDEFATAADPKRTASYNQGKLDWIFQMYENPEFSVDRKGTKGQGDHYPFKHRCMNFITTSQIDTVIDTFDRKDAGEGLFQRFDFVLNTEVFDDDDNEEDEIFTPKIDEAQKMLAEVGFYGISDYLDNIKKDKPVIISFKPNSPELKRWCEWKKKMKEKGRKNGAELYKKYIRAMVIRTFSQTKKATTIIETLHLIGDGDRMEGSEDGFPNKFVRMESLELALWWAEQRYETSLKLFLMLESGPVEKERSLMKELLQRDALHPLKIEGLGTIIRRSDALKHSNLNPVKKFNEMIQRFKSNGSIHEFKLMDLKTKRETIYLATFKEPTDKKIIDLIIEHFRR